MPSRKGMRQAEQIKHTMRDFNVMTLGDELPNEGLELVLASFSELYQRLTFKHHRRVKIKVICSIDRADWILTLARNYNIGANVELIPNKDITAYDWSDLEASILFLPTLKRAGKLTREALSQGIPLVAYQNESVSEYVDPSCGMLVRHRNRSQDTDAFSRILNMLYFDPEVRKLLKQGALKKYREISGHRDRRSVRQWSRVGAR